MSSHPAPSAMRPAFFFFLAYVAVLGSGLLPLLFLWRLPIGGVIETGQAEPMRWALAGALAVGGCFWLSRNRFWPWLMVVALLSGIATFCLLAGVRMDWIGLFSLAAVLAMMALAGQWFGYRGTFLAVAALIVAMLASLSSLPGRRDRVKVQPQVAVMTSLPLFWQAGQGGLAQASRQQKWLDATRVRARPLDHLDVASLRDVTSLLLAQPRLLAPGELVALDQWVRQGGKMVILADPWLVWSSPWPVGHALRPPVTSLLDPLLAHWGLELEPVPAVEAGGQPRRHLLDNGAVLTGAGMSRFRLLGGGCRLEQGGLMAICHPGAGKVRLIADADLLDDRLWLADVAMPGVQGAQGADTVALLDHWLVDPDTMPRRGLPSRIADDRALLAGVRWMLLFGLGWAVTGWWLQTGRDRLGKAGKGMGNSPVS